LSTRKNKVQGPAQDPRNGQRANDPFSFPSIFSARMTRVAPRAPTGGARGHFSFDRHDKKAGSLRANRREVAHCS
jgi:hypothetical protein